MREQRDRIKKSPLTKASRVLLPWATIAALFLLTACESDTLILTIENKSESLICFNPSEYGCLTRVEPDTTTENNVTLLYVCIGGSDERTGGSRLESEWFRATLAVEATDEKIYDKELTCRQWIDAGPTITVDQVGGELVVTDSVPSKAVTF